ncbi:MAG: hypothetical protein K2L15_04440, partial [Eubacteriales bacterium]|nr:hypothetical protein [Eubacteriales bacterium]
NIKSTNLNNIFIDDKINTSNIGNLLNKVNLNEYTLTNKYLSKKNTLNFKELSITYNENNEIIKIFYRNIFENNKLKINGKNNILYIKDVINILGKEYKESWYDKTQRLRQIIYKDKNNNLKAQFIFENSTGKLVFVIFQII